MGSVFMDKLRRKLHQKKGETLAEVMVAILVSAAGMLLLSSLIMASTRIVDKGAKSMMIMYDGATAMETKSPEPIKNQQMTVTFANGGTTVSNIFVDIYKDNESKLVSYTYEEGQTP